MLYGSKVTVWKRRSCKVQCQDLVPEEDHVRPDWTTSKHGQSRTLAESIRMAEDRVKWRRTVQHWRFGAQLLAPVSFHQLYNNKAGWCAAKRRYARLITRTFPWLLQQLCSYLLVLVGWWTRKHQLLSSISWWYLSYAFLIFSLASNRHPRDAMRRW